MQVYGVGPALGTALTRPTMAPAGESFGRVLSEAIHDLNEVQTHADDVTRRMAAGDDVDLHDVMIAVEEANLSFQLALQVRNRVLEAYQEIMRMQV